MKECLCPLFEKYNVDFYFSGHEHNFQILKHKKTYYVINGAGSFSSEVHDTNKDKDVVTLYANNNNGFCIHTIADKTFSVKFINTVNAIEHELFIVK
jgi:acid phosphatase